MPARLSLVLALGLLLSRPGTADAGGWTQPEGAFYAKVWNRTIVGRRAFVSERTTARLPARYQDHQLNIYGEYGISDDWTLTLNGVGAGYAVFGDEERFYSGGGALGVRYRLARGAVTWAIEVQAGFRPKSGNLASGLVEVQRGDTVDLEPFYAEPSVGTGHASMDLQVGYGLPFLWLTSTLGIRGFTNDERLKPAIYLNGQIGWLSNIGLVVDLHLNWYHSTGGIGPINVYGAGQTRYLGVGLGASWWFTEHVAVHAGLDGVLFATANAATPSLLLGMEFK